MNRQDSKDSIPGGCTVMAQPHTTGQLQKIWQENQSHFSTSTENNKNLLKVHLLTQKFQVFLWCLPRWGTQRVSSRVGTFPGLRYCLCTCPEPVLPRTEHSIPQALTGRGTPGCSCCSELCPWGFLWPPAPPLSPGERNCALLTAPQQPVQAVPAACTPEGRTSSPKLWDVITNVAGL